MRLLLTSLILLTVPLTALPASADPIEVGYCPEGQGMTVDAFDRRVQDCSEPVVWHCEGVVAVAGHCLELGTTAAGPIVEVEQCSPWGNSVVLFGKVESPCIASPCEVSCAATDADPISVNQCAGRGVSVTVQGKTTPCVYAGPCDPACAEGAEYVRSYYCGTSGIGFIVVDRYDTGCIPVCTDYCKTETRDAPVEVGSCWFGHERGIYVLVLNKFGGCYPVPRVDAPASHQDPEIVEQCGDRVAFQVTLHHAYQSPCIGLNVYVFECPGGHRIMIGDHPTGCLPTRPST